MALPENLLEKLRRSGLVVRDPSKASAQTGWDARRIVARATTEVDGVTVYEAPFFWIFPDRDAWFSQAHHNHRDRSDFFKQHDGAEAAVDWVIEALSRA